jgi:hypothetical protein
MTDPHSGERGASMIDDHPFNPRGAWWDLCRVCGLSEAAHTQSLTNSGVPNARGRDDDSNRERTRRAGMAE